MTLTSHASLFTGLYPTEHGSYPGVASAGRPLSHEFLTLSEVLREEGYITAAVAANSAYLAPSFGLNQGFQFWDSRANIPLLVDMDEFVLGETLRETAEGWVPQSEIDLNYRRASEITSEVFGLLDRFKQSDHPFFLFINYMDAHWPYVPPHPFDELFPGKHEQRFGTRRYEALQKQVVELERSMGDDERNHLISQYDGAITYLDHHLGQLMNRLRADRVLDDSIIIVTSDHGEHLGEKNLVGHCISVYNGLVHVPLLIQRPGSQARLISTPVSLVDIMPTVLDALGIEVPNGLSGAKLSNVDDGDTRMYLSESFPWDDFARTNRIERAIRLGTAKFITSTSGKREFYDLTLDPLEENNLYGKHALSATLEEAMKDWLDSRVLPVASPVTLDPETLERLKALGYVE